MSPVNLLPSKFLSLLTSAIIVILSVSPAGAQQPGPPQVQITPNPAQPGQDVTLTVRIPLAPGFHVYAPDVEFGTKLGIMEPGPILWDLPPRFPPTSTLNFLDTVLKVIAPDPTTHAVDIIITGQVPLDTQLGKYPIKLVLFYQACSDTVCLPPEKTTLSTTISIVFATTAIVPQPLKGGTTTIAAPPTQQTGTPSTAEVLKPSTPAGYGTKVSFLFTEFDLQDVPFVLSLVVAFVAGVILNIMPCVLPVIPIKVLQLVHDAQEHRRSVVGLSLSFCLGILAFFMAIGIGAVVLHQAISWGQHFRSPLFLVGTALLLIWLALGMFDAYQIQAPAFIRARSPRATSYAGGFLMGMLAGILSTPCSFGLLGGAVAWAQIQSAPVTLIVFATIGAGMAAPYALLASWPGWVQRIPTSGRWSELFKQAMGFVLLGVAAFLVSALPGAMLLAAMLYSVLFAAVVWLWGRLWQAGSTGKTTLAKLGAVAFLVLIGFFVFRPGRVMLRWEPLTPYTLAAAERSGQPYLVEFTADWCLNCRVVELLVFHNRTVIQAINDHKVVVLRGDLTEDDTFAGMKLREWTGRDAPPFTVVFRPEGRLILLPGIYSARDLLATIGDE
jgi:thiol:disulfide interchange protein